MSWSSPMTAVANEIFTSAQYNENVRDNLLETAPGIATTAGRRIVSTGIHELGERDIDEATVVTSEQTSSTSFVDLTTVGPSVTMTTGTYALVMFTVRMHNTVDNGAVFVGCRVSGATAIGPQSHQWLSSDGVPANSPKRFGIATLYTLTPGSNTFTLEYAVTTGTGDFALRNIIVMPL